VDPMGSPRALLPIAGMHPALQSANGVGVTTETAPSLTTVHTRVINQHGHEETEP